MNTETNTPPPPLKGHNEYVSAIAAHERLCTLLAQVEALGNKLHPDFIKGCRAQIRMIAERIQAFEEGHDIN